MLGEQVGHEKGKVTMRKVLDAGDEVAVEIAFEAMGKLLGADMQNMGTYASKMRADGTVFGTGQGVLMSKTGEMATWKGQGVGRMTDTGGMSFRGAIYVYSQTATWKKLNGCAVVYEHEVDAQGNVEDKLWEWR